MRKDRPSIDGFVPRHTTRVVGGADKVSARQIGTGVEESSIGVANRPIDSSGSPAVAQRVSRQEVDASLRDIEDNEPPAKKRRFLRRRRSPKAPRSLRSKIIRRVLLLLVLIVLAVGGYVASRALTAGNNIFKGNIFGILENKPLKSDTNGRTNVLILGTTDDDPTHPGNNLTDTMMIVSIDQNKHSASMFSIPRDLWVSYGRSCPSGDRGKINVVYSCANPGTDDAAEQDRLVQTQKFVGDIFGLDIQYAVHVNSIVVEDAVNAVGGVDVDVQGSGGAPGILDRNFDGQCHYTCYWVKYDNGVHHFDGQHAMYLSMARGDVAPTYGLGRSNFDREVNQQKVLMALRSKATSSGVLTNPVAVSNLLDAVGKNLRTNFDASEIQTLVKLAQAIPSDQIKQISLIDDKNTVVTTGMVGDQSVVLPTAGMFAYSDLRAFIRKSVSANDITREAANVTIFNGSGVSGYGKQKSDILNEKGFTITAVGNAPVGQYKPVQIYQLTSGHPATVAALKSYYGDVITSGASPISVASDTDFVIIYGPAASSN